MPDTVPLAPSAPLDAAARESRQIADQPPNPRTVALTVLTLLAVFYTLYFAAGFLLPLLLAVVLDLLLAPAKRLLTDRLHLPGMLAALLLIVALFAVVCALVVALSLPASNWVGKIPDSLKQLQERFGSLSGPIEFARHGIEQVTNILQPKPPAGQQVVTVQQSPALGGVGLTILLGTRAALGQVFTLAVMLLFLLADGDTLLRRLVEIMPGFGEKRMVVEVATEVERNISSYLVTVTAMNLLVGLANGASMWLLGMPDPLLWGTLAFLLNYIPILGPFAGMVIFFFVGLFSAPSIWKALLPPSIYLLAHIAEGESITPLLLARRFTLNPVLVILSLFFWDWLWGVAGAFMAVPLLAILKVVSDRIPALAPLGHLLGGPPARKRGDAAG
jgi:predicted PurR-regulated permease PerM